MSKFGSVSIVRISNVINCMINYNTYIGQCLLLSVTFKPNIVDFTSVFNMLALLAIHGHVLCVCVCVCVLTQNMLNFLAHFSICFQNMLMCFSMFDKHAEFFQHDYLANMMLNFFSMFCLTKILF